MLNTSVYDLIYEEEHQDVQNLLSNPVAVIDPLKNDLTMGKFHFDFLQCNLIIFYSYSLFSTENQVSFVCHMRKGGLEYRDEVAYESVQFIGYFRK